MDDIISVKNIDLTIGKNEILKHVNASFERGKIHGIIGKEMRCVVLGYGRP